MITKIIKNYAKLFLFSTVNFKKIGREVVPELPFVNIPIKPKPEEDERISTNLAYQTFQYQKKDRLPNCRYFAMEYNNRIYHFYNAYYYPLGRMVNRVATAIRGKNSPHFRNSVAATHNGDICVIVNIQDPLVTGKKLLFKKLRYHTGFIGHLRQRSYKQVLNHKPQLLYYYLLRKTMPKNKLSEKYMTNLILCRGPTHSLKSFPQFAPDKKIYEYLPQTDLMELVKRDKSYKVMSQSSPGVASQILEREVEYYESQSQKQQKRRQSDEAIQDLDKLHEQTPKYKMVPTITKNKYQVMKRKQKRIQDRYKPIRAPYKKKQNDDDDVGLKFYKDERQARKDPDYEILKNEQLQQIEDENVAQNPHKAEPLQKDDKTSNKK